MHEEKVRKIEEGIKQKRRVEGFSLDLSHIGPGEKRRLAEFMYNHGPGNGKMLFLPIDQGLEHGPSDFFPNPPSGDFEFQLCLAEEGGYSGVVCHIGLAERHMKEFAGRVPLILKVNGKTNIPSDEEAFSPLDATVEDAVRLGADAVGYTLYVGSPRQDDDFLQFTEIRQEAKRFGMPVIMWAYPRGKFAEIHGGRDSFAMVDYAARVANELGATLVKLNLPKPPQGGEYKPDGPFKKYNQYKDLSSEEALVSVVQSAGRCGVLVSGGSKMGDEDLLKKAKDCLDAGVDGLIFGRNMWQRKYEDALKITEEIKKMMKRA